MSLGLREILFIVLAVILIFGARRIPAIAKGIGSGIRNFKGSLKAGAEGDTGQGDDRQG
jgi:sec-independent protein translocase protein TatA